MLYHAELERKYIPVMIPLMTGNVVFPRFLSWDVDRKSQEFTEGREQFDGNIDAQITELLHTTAWYNNTLGTESWLKIGKIGNDKIVNIRIAFVNIHGEVLFNLFNTIPCN